MSNRIPELVQNNGLAHHILPVSGTMIGVCVTLIGLIKVAEATTGRTHVDEYAALAALVFLVSALTSYLSLRCSSKQRAAVRLERFADAMFLLGLVGITVVSTLFAYEVI